MEELEKTGSRLEMTRLLAELYKKVTPYEGRLVAYLSQGRLGPAYNNPNFGVADKMMVRVLGPEAEKLFKQLGDLGMVAEKQSACFFEGISPMIYLISATNPMSSIRSASSKTIVAN